MMRAENEKSTCPLCTAEDIELFFEDEARTYLRCAACDLVFVPRRHWLSAEAEKAVYDLHENNPHDPGYRKFLSRLSEPLLERLPPHRRGLDFGCGPGPTLSLMLRENGHEVDLYDPIYFNDASVFSKTYDFICAAEVVEHLRQPRHVFATLFSMLNAGGLLGVMTKLVIDRQAFSRWHYIRDLTHICFYSQSTFVYLARRCHAELEFVADDVMLLKKR